MSEWIYRVFQALVCADVSVWICSAVFSSKFAGFGSSSVSQCANTGDESLHVCVSLLCVSTLFYLVW